MSYIEEIDQINKSQEYNDYVFLLILLEALFLYIYSYQIFVSVNDNMTAPTVIPFLILSVESIVCKFVCIVKSDKLKINSRMFLLMTVLTFLLYLYGFLHL